MKLAAPLPVSGGTRPGGMDWDLPEKIPASLAARFGGPACPLRRQFVPAPEEHSNAGLPVDPLAEDGSPYGRCLVHRYPDRALLLVTNACPAHCRFCTRRRRAVSPAVTENEVHAAIETIAGMPGVRDVLVSGGDPLALPPDTLCGYLDRLRRLPQLRILRIGTRVPLTAPGRLDRALSGRLASFSPLYLNIHANHPVEIGDAFATACATAAGAGLVLGSQTVLLAGVNDDPEILEELFLRLLENRIRPYYLHLMDLVRGTAHFRVPLARALAIMRELQRRLSGMALPRLMLDLPGGGGKIPLAPDYRLEQAADGCWFSGPDGGRFFYPETGT